MTAIGPKDCPNGDDVSAALDLEPVVFNRFHILRL